jgi:hypothetical protein
MSTEDWITLQRFVGQLTSKTSKRGRGQSARDESLISLIETLRDPEGAIKSMRRQQLPSTEVMGLRQEIANHSVTANEALERVWEIEAQELRDGLAKVSKNARYQAQEITRLRKLLHSQKMCMADLERANGKLLQYQANEKLRRDKEARKVRGEKGTIYKARNKANEAIAAKENIIADSHRVADRAIRFGLWSVVTLFILIPMLVGFFIPRKFAEHKREERPKQEAPLKNLLQVGKESDKPDHGSGSHTKKVVKLVAEAVGWIFLITLTGAITSQIGRQ